MAQLISTSGSTMTVSARQKLKAPEKAERFCQDLMTKIQSFIEKDKTPVFDDLDVSQNPLPYGEFDNLFTCLSTTGVRVERIRFFGCATLDDTVSALLSDWLGTVTAETAPMEMHISDCALTTVGFTSIVEAIQNNEAFPFPDKETGKKCPVYVRVENNFIEDQYIQEKIDEGVIAEYVKHKGPLKGPVAGAPDAKIKLLVQAKGKFSQKKGTPPDPKDAPPPKQVWDWNAQQQAAQQLLKELGSYPQVWGSESWGSQAQAWQPSWGGGQEAWRPPAGGIKPGLVQQAKAPAWKQPQSQAVPKLQGKPKAVAKIAPKAQVIAPKATTPVQALRKPVVTPGATRTAADRSRTPAPKQPATKPAGGKKPLPKPWEEQWSDEYQIPYFWNPETLQSMWERPDA
jgi:hypothetical protein